MLFCKKCDKSIAVISGFGKCNCGVKPLQIIAYESELFDPKKVPELVGKTKILNLQTSNLILEYMEKASSLGAEKRELEKIPEEERKYIAGIGDIKSFLETIRNKKLYENIKPKTLIVPKLAFGYPTGVWFISKEKVKEFSIHPLGMAFHFRKIIQNPQQLIIFQDLRLGLDTLLKGYKSILGYPNILAHPKLPLLKNLLLIDQNPIIVYETLTSEQIAEILHLKAQTLQQTELADSRKYERRILIINQKAKRLKPENREFLVSKRNIIKVINGQWFDAKTGEKLMNFDVEITEIRKYQKEEIFLGQIKLPEGKKINFGTNFKNKEFTEFVEDVCKENQFYPIIKGWLKGRLLDILLKNKEYIPISDKPLFGFLPNNQISLPRLRIFKSILKKQWFGLHFDPFPKPADFKNINLTNGERTMVKILLPLFLKTMKGEPIQPIKFSSSNVDLDRIKLMQMGIIPREKIPGIDRWIFLGEHVHICQERDHPSIPGLIRGSKILAEILRKLTKMINSSYIP